MLKFGLCLAVLAISLSHVRSQVTKKSEQALWKTFSVFVGECIKELNLDVKEVEKLEDELDGKATDRCLFGCVLKKEGSINEEGKFDLDKGLETLAVVTNANDFKILESAVKTCSSVNDEEVSDGNKGCERAFSFVICVNKLKNGQ